MFQHILYTCWRKLFSISSVINYITEQVVWCQYQEDDTCCVNNRPWWTFAMYCLQWQTDIIYEPYLNLDFITLLKMILSLKFYVTNKSLKPLRIAFFINLLLGIPFTFMETSMEVAVALCSGICRKRDARKHNYPVRFLHIQKFSKNLVSASLRNPVELHFTHTILFSRLWMEAASTKTNWNRIDVEG